MTAGPHLPPHGWPSRGRGSSTLRFNSTRARTEDHRERAVFRTRRAPGRVTDENDRSGSLITQVFPGAVGDLVVTHDS